MGRPRKNQEKVAESIGTLQITNSEGVELSEFDLQDSTQIATHVTEKVIFDDKGLRKGIEYHFDELGFVDWEKMIDSKYIVPNRANFLERKQDVPKTIEGLDDKDKLITLAGFRKLATLRGFRSVDYHVTLASPEMICVECTISWRGNFETDYSDVHFSALADATSANISGEVKMFLSSIAENRAFVRAVRGFLNIPIVGNEEMGPVKDEETKNDDVLGKLSALDPRVLLNKRLQANNISFENLKQFCFKNISKDAEAWNSVLDVKPSLVPEILGKLDSIPF